MAALVFGATAYGQVDKTKAVEKKMEVKALSKSVKSNDPEKELSQLTEALNLSPEQQTKTRDLFKLREETFSKSPNIDAETRALYEKKFEDEFRTFLTPEQVNTLDNLKGTRIEKKELKESTKQIQRTELKIAK